MGGNIIRVPTRFIRPSLPVVLAIIATGAWGSEKLPEPLTLEYALSLAAEPHPEMEIASARLDQARAELKGAETRDGVNVSAEGRMRWVQPPPSASNQEHDDHKASLFARKNLYDFGRSAALRQAAHSRLSAADLRYQDALASRRIAITERYFDVLLADLEFSRQDENMAVVFVTLDRLRQRHELKQVSDVDLLKVESEYQSARRHRIAAEGRQRLTRAALADVLNRPGLLPTALERPALPQADRKLPEIERLYEAALSRNPGLRALRAQAEAADERVEAARAEGRPRINGELEASAYARNLNSNDEWRAGVNVEVPLYTGGLVSAVVSQRQAEVHEARARLRQGEMELRQAILDLWLQLQMLQVQRDEAGALRDYRELYLDRSRTKYEQEVTSDLGDAMVLLSEAELAAARARFQTALTWERIDALTGGAMALEITGKNEKN